MTQWKMSISDQIGVIVSGVLDIPEMADNQLALRFKRYFRIAGQKGQTAWDAPYRDGGFVTTGWRFKPNDGSFVYAAMRKMNMINGDFAKEAANWMTAYSWIIKSEDDDLHKEVRKIVSDLKTNNISDDLVDQQMMVVDIISFAQSLKERACFEDKDNSKKLTKFIVAAKAKERAIMARMGE